MNSSSRIRSKKRIEQRWWFWAIIAALPLVTLSTCVNAFTIASNTPPVTRVTPTPSETPMPAAEETPAPEPAQEPTQAPTTPDPAPTQQDPTGDQIAAYLAQATGHPTLDATCASGIRWACNIETFTPRGSTLEVRVTKLENPDGDAVARAIYNFLTLTSDSPMPDVSYVQITTATDGMVGSHRG